MAVEENEYNHQVHLCQVVMVGLVAQWEERAE